MQRQLNIDSLKEVLNERLYSQPEQALPIIDTLIQIAGETNDANLRGYMYCKQVEYYFPQFDNSMADSLAHEGIAYTRKHQPNPYLNYLQQTLIMRYANQQQYMEALETAKQMLADAHLQNNKPNIARAEAALANIYKHLGFYNDAIEHIQRSLNTLRAEENFASRSLTLENYQEMASLHQNIHQYRQMMAYTDSMRMAIDCRKSVQGDEGTESIYLSYYLAAEAAIGLKDEQQAEQYIAKAIELYNPNFPRTFRFTYFMMMMHHDIAQQRYQQAYAWSDSVLHFIQHYELTSSLSNALRQQADLLVHLGKADSAVHRYVQAIDTFNVNRNREHETQLNQLRTLHRLDLAEMQVQKEQLALRAVRRNFVAIVIIAILLLCIVSVAVFYSRRIRQKNKHLIQRIREQERLEETVSQLAEKTGSTQPEENVQESIFVHLATVMREQQLYTNPQITRDQIAEAIGTNRTYLTEAIKDATGYSFNEYLTRLRLSHARTLIDQTGATMDINTIVVESGFNSRSTFFRQFKDKYDMTPEEYRRLS
ncbi:response regulator transcription factor [Bacteroides sp. 519]|uniref:response regulator transcription factor n=1 Tax=Bacteroides sp. 519 TaxID=2302937 RepID=UPI0013D7325D|nr:response regulator transcription factor [Bacteroides sp. 519]